MSRFPLLLLATLLVLPSAGAATAAMPGHDGVLMRSEPVVTRLDRGPDEDRDGFPAFLTLHRERFVFYANGLVGREDAAPLVVAVDEDDRDRDRPFRIDDTPAPAGFTVSGDADGDGIPDSIAIHRIFLPGGMPAPDLVVPLDPEPEGRGEDVPHVGTGDATVKECGYTPSPAAGTHCVRSGATVRWKDARVDGPALRVKHDLTPLADGRPPLLRVTVTLAGRDVQVGRG